MIVYKDLDLTKYSTMRIHSTCEVMYTPENVPELRNIVAELKGNYYLLSAGSNVIFSNQVSRPIINLMKVDETMAIEDDVFTCGCSVRIQKFIRYAKDNGFGGIEFLYSLPASMGGIVYMNAGRGGGKRLSISDFLTEVTYLDCDSNEIRSEGIDKRQFSHHISPFQNKNCVIISCKLKLRRQTVEETELLIQERLDHCKKVQDSSVPNCGSTFSKGNKYIFKIFQMLGLKSGGAKFSKRTSDWIINTGGATSVDIKRLIKKMINVHKLIGADYKVEYQFFD